MLGISVDPTVTYDGPHAKLATVSGSTVWGLGDRFGEFAEQLGHRLRAVHRPLTPYGLGPQVEEYESSEGRTFLRIPSYGMVAGEDWTLRAADWKVFWILWQAGVEILIVGGTSGTCDWRDDEEAVCPGDLVLPWSYFSLTTLPSGLPGTELEMVLAERVALMDEPFCPVLADALVAEVQVMEASPFRRIHTRENRVVLNRWQYGAGFESAAMGLFLREYGRSIGSPVITGDLVSPILARVCGMHLLYYHAPSNWVEGIREQHLTGTLDQLYLETLPRFCATLELRLLASLKAPDQCRCRELLRERPPEYLRAVSPPAG